MSQLNELAEVDGAWQSIFADIQRLGDPDRGAFGHPGQRRLGLRVRANCWALLSRGQTSTYAFAVELSATGVVLKLLGRRARLLFRPDQRFRLDLFVPGASSPVRAIVRPVRPVADREAFELVEISPADRLTLAEHLDRQMAKRTRRTALESARRRPS
jgi:hypothetical protein